MNPINYWQDSMRILRQVWRHRELTLVMAKREFMDRYAGQVFGVYWGIAHPLLIMGVFLFLFGSIFRARIGGSVDIPFGYTMYLFSGMIPWLTFQEVLNKSPLAVTTNSNLVRQVIFPLEVLPVKVVLGSMPGQLVSILFMMIYAIVSYRFLPWTYLLLPVLLVLEFFLAVGAAFLLSAFGVFLKDTKDFVQFFTFVGIYLSPIVFLLEWVPEGFRPIIHANPLSHMIWCFQDACYFGRIEHPISWMVFIGFSSLVFITGARLFTRLKTQFGNYL
jgi:lipopolysaccharide transport system permease protein